ncbi:cysteine desulfurase [Gordonibacter sp. An230]|uniref:aminotransferase class V-fold PLP-dependent enzyme n=1 Tax=Gordonibacter sp. An230 TaxID=1965592 RepID=UPI000B38BD7E|nr:aminotransferase class V-fold PLP-dependent enzyme [Gordonibacter sp. An230]OUO88896.1 cysteine desulfurase [Gordonibacter sp. An230]
MIYLDNAATTARKPPEVAAAVARAIDGFGGAGRGAHGASLDAGVAVLHAREALARLLGAPSPSRVAFCANATEALNAAVAGLLRPGERAVTTAASHNSMLRPLFRKQDEEGCEVAVVPHDARGALDYGALERELSRGARLVAVAHASNLTGDVYDVARIARLAHEHGALVLVDAAQTAGCVPLDMVRDGIDLVAFTGHKSLYGPQGTGGLAALCHVEVPPFKEGGSGARSYDRRHPARMPESLEAGTLNAHGLAGLAAGVAFVQERGVEAAGARARALAERFELGVRAVPGVRVLGGGGDAGRCGIVAINVADVDSAIVAGELDAGWGICVRAGAHCAPLMHEALGTRGQGAVRFSFSCLGTEAEADAAVRAVAEVAEAAFS